MTENSMERRRGPYGRHTCNDTDIDSDTVEKQWLEKESELEKMQLGTQAPEADPAPQINQRTEIPFSIDDIRKSTDKGNGQDLEENVDFIQSTDYELCCDDIDDTDDMCMELDPSILNTTENDWENINSDSEPLYPGSSVSIGAFMLLLAVFTSKYNLIGDAIQQLLNIISFVLPTGHNLCSTLHEFKKFFKNLRNPLVYHYYCSYCSGIIEDSNITKCPYEECGHKFDKKSASYFLEMPLKNQIQNLFKQEGFYEMLQNRFHRRADAGRYEDIYDGDIYKQHFTDGGILNNPHNVSFSFNTDGAAVFKSSNVSVWPLFLVINELPYKIRMKKENMLLASLWFGNTKPNMGTFLKPFQKSMTEMFEGIECMSPSVGSFICKGIILCGTADLPARSLLCNHIQYNGAFACWKCEQEGRTSKVGKGHARIFPYDATNPKGPARTLENVVENAQLALDSPNTVKGIKGPSWLLFFPSFNIVAGIAIDYMHGVLLGVEKLLTELWFSQKFSKKTYSLYNKLKEVDDRLLSIHPTLDITRLPRSLLDITHWKASEFRSFLLFYSAPVLYGILDDEHFAHYLLLVNSMHILLKCGSSEKQIESAESMLLEFCSHFQYLYDECFMRLNIHQLLHLPDCVRNLGPLYTSSCFSYENKNGFLLKMIRGSQNIDNQIATGVSFVQKLPELKSKCIESGSACDKIYNSIETPTVMKRNITVEKGFYILGGISERTLAADECEALQTFIGAYPLQEKYMSFNRIELKDTLIYGLSYTRMVKRNNAVIEYINLETNTSGFGQVRHFINLGELITSENILAIVEPLICPNYNEESNILNVYKLNSVKAVRAKDIIAGCMLVSFSKGSEMYVCRFPNRLESD